jgi:hypothetical protein
MNRSSNETQAINLQNYSIALWETPLENNENYLFYIGNKSLGDIDPNQVEIRTKESNGQRELQYYYKAKQLHILAVWDKDKDHSAPHGTFVKVVIDNDGNEKIAYTKTSVLRLDIFGSLLNDARYSYLQEAIPEIPKLQAPTIWDCLYDEKETEAKIKALQSLFQTLRDGKLESFFDMVENPANLTHQAMVRPRSNKLTFFGLFTIPLMDFTAANATQTTTSKLLKELRQSSDYQEIKSHYQPLDRVSADDRQTHEKDVYTP